MNKQKKKTDQVKIPGQTKHYTEVQHPGVSTPALHNKYGTWIHIGLLLLIFLVAYIPCFTSKINIGGDNIYYFTLGKALATGAGYVDIITPELTPNNHFPPGYPFIISLFMRLGFTDISFFYGLNGVLAFLSIIVLYRLLIRLDCNYRFVFVVCLFVAISPGYLSFAITNMSEIPYIFFSLLTLYFLAGIDFKKKFYSEPQFVLMLICAITAYYIRSSGLALILAIVIYFLVKKQWKFLMTFIIVFVLCILPWQLRSSALGGNSYVKQLLSKNPYAPELGPAHASDFLSRILSNILRYISVEIPSAITGGLFEGYENPLMKSWIIGILAMLLALYAMFKLSKLQKALPLILYMMFTAGILLLWPEKWTGIRFMVPVLPILFFLIIYSLNIIAEPVCKKIKLPWNPYVLCVLAIFILGPIRTLSRLADEPYPQNYQNYFDLAAWAKDHTPENSIICCRKPELFYLFSDRKCITYPFTLDSDSVIHSMEHNKVDFVVVEQLGFGSTGRYLAPAINNNKTRFWILYMLKKPETYFIKFLKPGEKPPQMRGAAPLK